MEPFRLTADAILDIDEISLYLMERERLEVGDRIVTELFRSFDRLAAMPRIGHRRSDLTRKDVLFFKTYSYLIVYTPRIKPLSILGILHGSRNIARILRRRL